MVHGQQVSQVQRDLFETLGGELNQPFGRYNIDVALSISDVGIAVEYDSWYWHSHRQEKDAQRDEELIAAGWRVLRIKSNTLLPAREQLDAALARLLKGESRVEIVLDDWGEGPTRFEGD
jgi:very-short-patch-repair endonuclease